MEGKTESIKSDRLSAVPMKCIIKASSFPVYFIDWAVLIPSPPTPPPSSPPKLGRTHQGKALEASSSVRNFYINAAGQRAKASSNWALDSNQALWRLWSCLVHTLQVASCLPTEITLPAYTSTLFLGFCLKKKVLKTHTHTHSCLCLSAPRETISL